MGCRLRSRLLDRCRLVKALVILLVLTVVFGSHKHRDAITSLIRHEHEISSHSTAQELVAAISFGRRLTATDASQPQYAQALCREHGLHIFHKSPVPRPGSGRNKRKVFDLLTVNGELDWLEIRLNSTYDFVDFFVIVEGRKTLTDSEGPLMLQDNWARFSAYHDKIIYHELEYPVDVNLQHNQDFETYQRNAPFTQVFPHLNGAHSPTQGDVLLVGNVDELVRPEALLVLRACETPRRLTLHSKLYYYSFQYLHRGMDWPHPQATTYQDLDGTISPDDLRRGDGAKEWGYFAPAARWADKGDLWNAGWHCSSCSSNVDEVVETMEGSNMFSNGLKLQQRRGIVPRVEAGKDLRNTQGVAVDRVEHKGDVSTASRIAIKRWW